MEQRGPFVSNGCPQRPRKVYHKLLIASFHDSLLLPIPIGRFGKAPCPWAAVVTWSTASRLRESVIISLITPHVTEIAFHSTSKLGQRERNELTLSLPVLISAKCCRREGWWKKWKKISFFLMHREEEIQERKFMQQSPIVEGALLDACDGKNVELDMEKSRQREKLSRTFREKYGIRISLLPRTTKNDVLRLRLLLRYRGYLSASNLPGAQACWSLFRPRLMMVFSRFFSFSLEKHLSTSYKYKRLHIKQDQNVISAFISQFLNLFCYLCISIVFPHTLSHALEAHSGAKTPPRPPTLTDIISTLFMGSNGENKASSKASINPFL